MMSLSPPTDAPAALRRLPDQSHPLLTKDSGIAYLHTIRGWLEGTLEAERLPPLHDRIKGIVFETLLLMEQTSFARDRNEDLVVKWVTLPEKSPWAPFLNATEKEDDSFAHWRVSPSEPKLGDNLTLLILERDIDFNNDKPQFGAETTDYFLLLLTDEEYKDFTETLLREYPPVEG